ncbi:MAG: F0F1 ATP synthase subunit epsilon [Acidobacteriota bacterium]|jgi:F-type H+-transporting ATPase subunit epsilon
MAEKLPEKLKLEIVTPTRQLFEGEVDEVTVPGLEGYLGILPGHAPLLSELKVGVLSFRIGSDRKKLFCGWGFVEVLPDQVSVLAEAAELPEEIDVTRAGQEKLEAEARLRAKAADTDFPEAINRLEAAIARLEAAGLPSR